MSETIAGQPAPSAGPRRPLLLAALIVGLFLLSAGWRLGAAPIAQRAELRVHDVAVGMLATGDWLVPMRDGEPRLNKPPLMYWAVATLAELGGVYDTAMLRLPSLLSGLGLVLLMLGWGRALGGWRLALLSALMLACTVGVHTASRSGTAELMLALTCQMALLAFDGLHHHGRSWLVAFGVSFALAILAKATAALLIVGLPIAVHLGLRRRLRAALSARVLAVLGLACVAGFAWYAVILAVLPGAWGLFLNAALLPAGVQAGVSPEAASATHYGGLHEQFVNLLEIAMPVTLLAPVLVRRALKTGLWRHAPSLRLAALVVISLLIAFSLIPQKQPHYLLPILPSLALLTAESVLAAADRAGATWRPGLRRYGLLACSLGLLASLAVAIWFGYLRELSLVAVGLAALAGVAASLGAARVAARGQLAALVVLCGLGSCALFALYDDVELWRRSFKTGAVTLRDDFDQAHWDALRASQARLAKAFEVDDEWVGMLADDPLALGTGVNQP